MQQFLLQNAGAGTDGDSVVMSTDSVTIILTATDWAGESVTLQHKVKPVNASEYWGNLPNGSFTSNDAVVLDGYRGQEIRAVTSDGGGTMTGVYVILGPRRH